MNEYRQEWKKYRWLVIYWVAIFAAFIPVVMTVSVLSARLSTPMLRFPMWQALGHFCGSYTSYVFVRLTAHAVENALLADGGSAISFCSVNVRTAGCRGTPTLWQCSLPAAKSW